MLMFFLFLGSENIILFRSSHQYNPLLTDMHLVTWKDHTKERNNLINSETKTELVRSDSFLSSKDEVTLPSKPVCSNCFLESKCILAQVFEVHLKTPSRFYLASFCSFPKYADKSFRFASYFMTVHAGLALHP